MPDFPLHIRVDRREGEVTLRLEGYLFSSNLARLARMIDAEEARGLSALIFDLGGVVQIDSRGIGALVAWHRHFTTRDAEFRLQGVSGQVIETLQVCGLVHLMEIGPPPGRLTDRLRHQREALWGSHQYAQQVLMALGEGLVGLNADREILFLNPAAEQMLRAREEALLGRRIDAYVEFGPETARAPISTLHPLDAMQQGRRTPFHGEGVLRPVNGVPTVPVDLTLVPVFRGLVYLGAVVGFLDASARKASELALRRARADAEAAAAARSEFMAMIAHEIRNPLNGVVGVLELLAEGNLDEEQSDLVRTARESTRSLLFIVNDLLDFARLEAGQLAIDLTEVDVRPLIEELLGLFGPQAKAKGLALTSSVQSESSLLVRADQSRLRQILINLLTNALKFTQRGEIALGVEPEGAPASRRLRFSVRDTGVGLDHERLARLLAPGSAPDPKHPPRGLGLIISRRLCELMGGQLGAESRPGAGSTFWFTLPQV